MVIFYKFHCAVSIVFKFGVNVSILTDKMVIINVFYEKPNNGKRLDEQWKTWSILKTTL